MIPLDVQRVLQRFSNAYWPDRLVSIGTSSGFSGALITKLVSPAGEFSLRGWPPNSLPGRRLLGLHRLTAEVHRRGITQVPVPVTALDGSSLVEFQRRYWQLEPWMSGQADYWQYPNRRRLRASMTCLAKWHQAAADFVSRGQEQPWFDSRANAKSPAVKQRLGSIQQFNRERCEYIRRQLVQESTEVLRELAESILDSYQQVVDRVAAELNSVRETRFQLQPCIRDIWHDHVLFTDDAVTGLIDLGASRVENVAADLSRLLGSLVGDDELAWQAALKIYQQQRPLTLDEQRLMRTLDRSSVALSGMIWLDRLYVQERRFPRVERVVERMNRIRDRLLYLARVQ